MRRLAISTVLVLGAAAASFTAGTWYGRALASTHQKAKVGESTPPDPGENTGATASTSLSNAPQPTTARVEAPDHTQATLPQQDLEKLTDEELIRRTEGEGGDLKASSEYLARRGFEFKDRNAGGNWIERRMTKNGEPTALTSFLIDSNGFSTGSHLSIGCSDGGSGMIVIFRSDKPWVTAFAAGGRVMVSALFSTGDSSQDQQGSTLWRVLDGKTLVLLSDPKELALQITHSYSFTLATNKEFAMFDVEGLDKKEFDQPCGL